MFEFEIRDLMESWHMDYAGDMDLPEYLLFHGVSEDEIENALRPVRTDGAVL